MDKLTKHNSFEAMKQLESPFALAAAEKKQFDAETKQMAELFQALRVRKYHGNVKAN